MASRSTKCIVLAAMLASIGQVSDAIASCDLQSTPLANMGRCAEYKRLDNEFNAHYQMLLKKRSPEFKAKLRNIQRDWIVWREEKCDEVQENSGCNENGSCNGVAHDYCIIDLTRMRDEEFQGLLKQTTPLTAERLLFLKDFK
jgi:uncharacterized protein YecT (DUF1311 family)